MKRYIKSNDDAWNYDPYHGKTYRVVCGDVNDSDFYADSPYSAIVAWFRGQSKYPGDCAIMTRTKADALNLLDISNDEEFIYEYTKRYNSPYKVDWMMKAIQDNLRNNARGFDEGEYGDQISPFTYG